MAGKKRGSGAGAGAAASGRTGRKSAADAGAALRRPAAAGGHRPRPASSPQIILFDEPTSALDPEMIGEVLQVMKTLAHSGITMLVVTHEMQFAREIADRVVFIDGGDILEVAPPAEFFAHPQHARARRFLQKVLIRCTREPRVTPMLDWHGVLSGQPLQWIISGFHHHLGQRRRNPARHPAGGPAAGPAPRRRTRGARTGGRVGLVVSQHSAAGPAAVLVLCRTEPAAAGGEGGGERRTRLVHFAG